MFEQPKCSVADRTTCSNLVYYLLNIMNEFYVSKSPYEAMHIERYDERREHSKFWVLGQASLINLVLFVVP